MNCLLIYLKPKDELDRVEEALKEIPCDRLILSYFPYPTVYQIAMKTVKEHPEYSHIIWVQNDIVFTREAYLKMTRAIEKNGFSILGCSMNVDLSPAGQEKCAYTVREFNFPTGHKEWISALGVSIPYVRKGEYSGIIRVYHNGGPFIVERDFFLRYPLTGVGKAGYNADIKHGKSIYDGGFDYFLDCDLHLEHLRYLGVMQVGRKEPKTEFVKYERF